jgi:hypothetical protein
MPSLTHEHAQRAAQSHSNPRATTCAHSGRGSSSCGAALAAVDTGPEVVVELVPGRVSAPENLKLVPAAAHSPAPALPRRAVVQPLAPARYKVQFTASAELHDKLERLAALMRSEVPDGDIAAIIERAVAEKLARLEARRFAASAAPRKALADTDTSRPSRHVPAAVRRAVRARDGDGCRFVDDEGRRCSERHRLEFHHRHPYGMGGNHRLENISLLCPQHNRYLAERDYGQAAIRRRSFGDDSRSRPD